MAVQNRKARGRSRCRTCQELTSNTPALQSCINPQTLYKARSIKAYKACGISVLQPYRCQIVCSHTLNISQSVEHSKKEKTRAHAMLKINCKRRDFPKYQTNFIKLTKKRSDKEHSRKAPLKDAQDNHKNAYLFVKSDFNAPAFFRKCVIFENSRCKKGKQQNK